MENYQQMYLWLFNRVSDALVQMANRNYGIAEDLLRQGQIECEELYLAQEPEKQKSDASS